MTQTIDWYSPTNIKSYNKFLNFIIGGRGIGKTYGFKKDCISRYKTKVKLSNGKIFEIEAQGVSEENKYIQSANLNGQKWKMKLWK